jgi:hypothetical protein
MNEEHFKLECVECVNGEGRVDPLLVGVNNSDLYWIERGSKPNVIEYSIDVENGQVLVESPGVNWHAWLENGENKKTSAIIKSEAHPAPTANALVRLPYGKGEIMFCQIVARAQREKSRRVVSTMLENLGVPMTKERFQRVNTGADEDGFIRSWLVSGPYSSPDQTPNELDHDWLGGEAAVVPAVGDKWVKHDNVVGRDLDFHSANLFPDKVNAVAYAAVYVWSARSGEVLLDSPDMLRADLRLGSDDGVKVWLNGKEIWNNPAMRAMVEDADVVSDVKLRRGWNLLLLKVGQGTGDWQAIARFTTPSGAAVPDLKYSLEVPDEFKK